MKAFILIALMGGGLVACNNNGISAKRADSLKQELDTSFEKIKDSVKAKGERTLESVKEKLEDLNNKRDSTR